MKNKPQKPQSQFSMLFKEESARYLESLNSELLRFEKDPDDIDLLEGMMRELHSLKGAANMIGLTEIGKFAHRLEDAFVHLKTGEYSPWEFDLLFSSFDLLKKMVDDATSEKPKGIDYSVLYKKLKTIQNRKRITKKIKKKDRVVERDIDLAVFRTDLKNFIHIDVSKVDTLMGLVNELIIHKGRITKRPNEVRSIFDQIKYIHKSLRQINQVPDLEEGMVSQIDALDVEIVDLRDRISFLLDDMSNQSTRLDRLIDQLEGTAIKMRMLPLSVIFSKMERLVRDLSKAKEKQIKLIFSGEGTELDKKIIEVIQDPIMHLIRNSIDHGVELPAIRKKAGKLPEGVIIINAYQRGNRIIMEIEDDGGGVDKERVKEIAIEKKLVTSAEADKLEENEIFELLFQPGFSTKKEITDVSGRGVGLNVVRDALSQLQGIVKIESQRGLYTKFVFDLPISVAVASIFMLSVSGRLFAIPTSEVKETIKGQKVDSHATSITVNNEEVPFFSLQKVLNLPEMGEGSEQVILILEFMNKPVALAVDTLEGEEHVIIKTLGEYLGKVRNVAGAAILGDARLVVVLDLQEILSSNWRQLAVEA